MERPSLFNLEAEQAVLGSMLIERKAVEIAAETLTTEDFGSAFHRRIFAAMLALLERDDPIDEVALTDALNRRGGFGEGESPSYFFQLTHMVPHASAVEHYASIVSGLSTRRRLLEAIKQQTEAVFNLERDVQDVTADCGKAVEVASARAARRCKRTMREIVAEVMEELEAAQENQGRLTGVPTGLFDLDRATNGWQKGDLILIGARPGVGKTAVCANTFAGTALFSGRRVAMFSLEMKDKQIVKRMIASFARVNMGHMAKGLLNTDDWRRVGQIGADLSPVPLELDDTSDLTPSQIRLRLRQMERSSGRIDLVIVDYLALMSAEQTKERDWRSVDECAKAMKRIAKEFDVPVILLTQLNKEIDKRSEGRPVLADIKEAGEAHADIVAFLWPAKSQVPDSEVRKVWLSLAKHRNGPLGDIPLAYHGAWTRFDQMADDEAMTSSEQASKLLPRRETKSVHAITSQNTATTRPPAYKDNDEDSTAIPGSALDTVNWNPSPAPNGSG